MTGWFSGLETKLYAYEKIGGNHHISDTHMIHTYILKPLTGDWVERWLVLGWTNQEGFLEEEAIELNFDRN